MVRGEYQIRNHLSADTSAMIPFDQVQTDAKLFGKLTLVPGENDFVNLALTRRDQHTSHAGLTGRETLEATTDYAAPTTLLSGTWQHLLSKSASVELKLQGFGGGEADIPFAGPAVPGIYTYELGTTRSYQNAPLTTENHAQSVGGTTTLDVDRQVYGVANHFRLGLEYDDATWRETRTRNAGMTWRPRYSLIDHSADSFDPVNASTWQGNTPTTWGGEKNLATHTVNSAVFLQDELKKGDWSIHPGVRLGRWAGDLDPTSVGVSTRTRVLSDMAIDPRLGVTAFFADSDAPTRLVAHVGRYHQSVFSDLFDRASGANAYTDQDVWEYLGPSFSDPRRVITAGERDALASSGQFRQIEHVQLSQSGPLANYHQPYVDQLLAGLQSRPSPHWRVEILFVGRNNHDMVALVDRNVATNYHRFDYVNVFDRTGKPVLDSDGRPLQLASVYIPNDAISTLVKLRNAYPDGGYILPPGITSKDTNLKFNPDYVITNPAGARREFRQWQLTLDTEYETWKSSFTVEFTGLDGNFSTLTGYDDLSTGGFEGITGRGPGPWVRPNEAINFEGGLDQGSFATVKWRLIGSLPLGFRGGAAAEFISGDQLTPSFTIVPSAFTYQALNVAQSAYGELFPLLIQSISRQRIYTRQMGRLAYSKRTTVDLHLERAFSGRFGEVVLQADGFNILASDKATRVNTALSSNNDPNSFTTYLAPLELQAPRRVRFGAAVSW